MKLYISESAFQDLAIGYDFYDAQEKGLGDYFEESLFSDIDSLKIYAGIHQKYFGKHRMLLRRFHGGLEPGIMGQAQALQPALI